ncbi:MULTISPECIES: hypothetical protein [Mycobacterium avium complex (MAC)]|uniref:Uncharacterized protein n=1 Tax=Mycobacterium intracellulare subsp. chimaera TaxID=222805 RepID=A0ABT7P664_MYCIT|nr:MULTISPECIES: hypothetical protein [Mycobacterium avium complex (MAC)]AOS95048.1 hypothetical protein AN480_28940 [Mycobacterium intracellulare subsp. chimaera]MDM3928665.1 hypothetical protein [Mycobacterium intracellulare subsp. chimaera]PBA69037.1 hypothetical protein CKJ76_24635 [Mycobacterium avium]
MHLSMVCELSQQTTTGPFLATLVREERRFWDDDPDPDVVETIVGAVELRASMPDVFTAVNTWLAEHGLRVPTSSWQPGDTGPDTGVVILLDGACEAV